MLLESTPVTMSRSENPEYIDWGNSEAKMILMADLHSGELELDWRKFSVKQAGEKYRFHPAFHDIVCYEQFKQNLSNHRRSVKKNLARINLEQEAFEHDRRLYPDTGHNHLGELKYQHSETQELLRDDVASGLHLLMTPSKLRSSRPEYKAEFGLEKFTQHINQEVRYQKYVYYLDQQRQEKEIAAQEIKEKKIAERAALREQVKQAKQLKAKHARDETDPPTDAGQNKKSRKA